MHPSKSTHHHVKPANMPTTKQSSPRKAPRTTKLDVPASRRLIRGALGMTGSRRKSKDTHSASTSRTRASVTNNSVVPVEEMDVDGDNKHQKMTRTGSIRTADDDTNSSLTARVEEAADNLTLVLNRYVGDQGEKGEWENPLKVFEDISRERDKVSAACRQKDADNASLQSSNHQHVPGASSGTNEEGFRSLYMDIITTAFSAELDDIRTGRVRAATKPPSRGNKRKKGTTATTSSKGHDAAADSKGGESIFVDPDHEKEATEIEASSQQAEKFDVDVLIDIIQAGMNCFTEEERAMLQEECTQREKKYNDDDGDDKSIGLTPHEQRRIMLGFAPPSL